MKTYGSFIVSSGFFSSIAYFLYAFAALLILSGYLGFFSPLFDQESIIWMAAHHSVWAIYSLAAIFSAFIIRQSIALLMFYLLSFVFAFFLYAFDGGWVAKNLIQSAAIALIVLSLALASGVDRCLRLVATLTTTFSVVVVFDALFLDGLSTTIGRSAGFYMNPNTAAGVLIMGMFATLRVVRAPYRLSFIILVLTAVFFTLSRSSLLVACIGIALYVASYIRSEGFRSIRASFGGEVKLGLVLAAFLTMYFFLVLMVNPRFIMAFKDAYSGIYFFIDLIIAVLRSSSFETGGGFEGLTALEVQSSEGLTALEAQSSEGARLVLLLASIDAFMSSPWLGLGFDQAHALRPHNTLLLFMVGLGVAGMLVPLLLLFSLSFGAGRDNRILAMIVFLLMIFSHDILLSSSFIFLIATSIAATMGGNKLTAEYSRGALTAAICAFAATCSFFSFFLQENQVSTLRNELGPQNSIRIEGCIYYVDPIVFDWSNFYMVDVPLLPSRERYASYELYDGRGALRQDFKFDIEVFLNCDGRFFVNEFGGVFFTADHSDGGSLAGGGGVLKIPLTVHPVIYIFNILVVLASLISTAQILFKRRFSRDSV